MPLNAHKFYITPKKRNYETNDLCYCSSCYYNTLLLSKKQRAVEKMLTPADGETYC